MRDIDNDIRASLERLTNPHSNTPGTEALWGDLVDRRRKRRNRNRTLAALPLLLVAVLAVGLFATRDSSDSTRSDVAAGGADAPSSDGFDGSWTIAATVEKGERKPAHGSANLVISGDRVQGDDGCGNRIDTSLNADRITPPQLRTQMACPDLQFIGAEGDLFWESLGNRMELRGGELWLVNDQGDGLIFERTESTDNEWAVQIDPSPGGGVDGPVLYGPEQNGDMEQALLSGRIMFQGDCLYLHQESDAARYAPLPVVWPNGTTWQDSPEGIRFPDGTFVPVGESSTATVEHVRVSGAGGIHDFDTLAQTGHHPDVQEAAQDCALALEGADAVAYIQGEVTVTGQFTAAIEAATSSAYDFELVSATEADSEADLAEVQFLLDGVSVTAIRQSYDERPPDEALSANNPYEVEVLADGSELIVIEGPYFNQAILFDADGIMTNLVSSTQPGITPTATPLPAAALRDIVLRVAELADGP